MEEEVHAPVFIGVKKLVLPGELPEDVPAGKLVIEVDGTPVPNTFQVSLESAADARRTTKRSLRFHDASVTTFWALVGKTKGGCWEYHPAEGDQPPTITLHLTTKRSQKRLPPVLVSSRPGGLGTGAVQAQQQLPQAPTSGIVSDLESPTASDRRTTSRRVKPPLPPPAEDSSAAPPSAPKTSERQSRKRMLEVEVPPTTLDASPLSSPAHKKQRQEKDTQDGTQEGMRGVPSPSPRGTTNAIYIGTNKLDGGWVDRKEPPEVELQVVVNGFKHPQTFPAKITVRDYENHKTERYVGTHDKSVMPCLHHLLGHPRNITRWILASAGKGVMPRLTMFITRDEKDFTLPPIFKTKIPLPPTAAAPSSSSRPSSSKLPAAPSKVKAEGAKKGSRDVLALPEKPKGVAKKGEKGKESGRRDGEEESAGKGDAAGRGRAREKEGGEAKESLPEAPSSIFLAKKKMDFDGGMLPGKVTLNIFNGEEELPEKYEDVHIAFRKQGSEQYLLLHSGVRERVWAAMTYDKDRIKQWKLATSPPRLTLYLSPAGETGEAAGGEADVKKRKT